MPKPVQAAALIAGGSGVTAALILIPARYAIALVIGLAVVAGALLLYRRSLKWRSQRRSAPMEEGVLRSGAPQLRKAEEKVKIDNLRRRFEDGIGKFREAGKNLYSLPWFMIVGEPGSGKTEAIRHCNVGFPPGLQDEYQGVGGTINMNWWFTNYGVVIDTAGRLMFEDVETGGTKEWKEFLNLLKKYRPYCPINGVFLVIPADSLVKDTAEQIQQKASQIAQQFNVIQRTLAVRFPVFVVVTKCDLVMGFREFFDGLSNPELQHQIFGWSNPATIDQPYNRDFVRQHLQSVQDRLHRRRLSLLLELAGDDAAAHESASVNALYSFPKSLAQLAPRMARYLDLIFGAGGEWGAKPVFFRGIYFTSSMQEGAALDEDLAQALGISVESLPEGPAWTRDRAYFLRDLFVKKVFPESGLVTTAVNATKEYIRRRMAFWLSLTVAVLFLLIYTIYVEYRFKTDVEPVKSYVSKAADAKTDPSLLRVVNAEKEVAEVHWDEMVKEQKVQRYRFCSSFNVVIDEYKDPNEKGGIGRWLLSPLTSLFNVDAAAMREALKNVFESSVLRPFYEETSELMRFPPSSGEDWTIGSSELNVLAQLIKLREGTATPASFFNPFYNYWWYGRLKYKTKEERNPDVPIKLNAVLNDLYVSAPNKPDKVIYPWPPQFLSADPNLPLQAEKGIAAAIDRFVKDWDPNNRGNVKGLSNLFDTLQAFDKAEQELWGLDKKLPKDVKEGWPARFTALDNAKKRIDDLFKGDPNITSLKSKYELIKEEQRNALGAYDVLFKAFGYDPQKGLPNQQTKTWPYEPVRTLVEGEEKWKKLEKDGSQGKLAADLDENFWLKGLYKLRYQDYNDVNPKLVYTYPKKVSVHGDQGEKAAVLIKTIGEDVNNIITKIEGRKPSSPAYGFDKAEALCEYALNLAKEERIDDVVQKALKTAASNSAWLISEIADKVTRAKTYLEDWVKFREHVKDSTTRQKTNKVYEDYVRDYWLGEYLEKWIDDSIPKKSNWADQYNELRRSDDSSPNVRDKLKILGSDVSSVVELIFPKGSRDPNAVLFWDNLDMLSRPVLQNPYRNVASKWTGLTSDAYVARNDLLNMKPGDFLDAYFPGRDPAVPAARFVDLYWWRFSLETLRALSQTPPGLPPEANDLGRKYCRYPLLCNVSGADRTSELSTEELDYALKLWSQAAKPSYGEGTIGRGARVGLTDVNDLLGKLRSTPSSFPPWFIDFGKRLVLVSTVRNNYSHVEFILSEEGNEDLILKLHYVGVKEATLNSEDKQRTKLISGGGSLGTISWSKPGVTFCFYTDYPQPDSKPNPEERLFEKSDWMLMRIWDKVTGQKNELIIPVTKWSVDLHLKLEWLPKNPKTP